MYAYDANGNMITRTVNDQTFNLSYDAENRLVGVSGALTASFVYDGDGKRVKSTIAGVTTYFVGNIYEKTGTTETKYYYAGGARVAMRVCPGGTCSAPTYLLSDHLGSTTVTTDASGNLVSELKYKPWGETRSASGTTPTDYTFTGQYSNVSDFGLMFYNARWYDPGLGRFAQADSIVPAGVQGYDRYAYVNNSPVNFTDPSGHKIDEGCGQGKVCEIPQGNSRTDSSAHEAERFHYETFGMYQVVGPYNYNPDTSYAFTGFPGGGDPAFFPKVQGSQNSSVPQASSADAVSLLNDLAAGMRLPILQRFGYKGQTAVLGYETTYPGAPRADASSVVTLHSLQIRNQDNIDSMINYRVIMEQGGRFAVGEGHTAPRGTADIRLPTHIEISNGMEGLHVTISAFTACAGPCLRSPSTIEFYGRAEFVFNP
jgi:RHS repeat-associated protein